MSSTIEHVTRLIADLDEERAAHAATREELANVRAELAALRPVNMRNRAVEISDATVEHPIVERVMAELRGNLEVGDDGLPAYGIAKVAAYAAQVGAALALGYNPEILRTSSPEARAYLENLAAAAAAAGVPVHVVIDGDDR